MNLELEETVRFIKQPAAFPFHLLLMTFFLSATLTVVNTKWFLHEPELRVFVQTRPVCLKSAGQSIFLFPASTLQSCTCMQVGVLQVFVIVTSFSVCRATVTEIWTDRLWVCVESRAPAVCYLTSTLIFHTDFVHVHSVQVWMKKQLKHTSLLTLFQSATPSVMSVKGSERSSK